MHAESMRLHAETEERHTRPGQRPRNLPVPVTRREPPKLNPGATPFMPLSQRTTAGLTTSTQSFPGAWRGTQPTMTSIQSGSVEQPGKATISTPVAEVQDQDRMREDSSNDASTDSESDGASCMSDTPQKTLRYRDDLELLMLLRHSSLPPIQYPCNEAYERHSKLVSQRVMPWLNSHSSNSSSEHVKNNI